MRKPKKYRLNKMHNFKVDDNALIMGPADDYTKWDLVHHQEDEGSPVSISTISPTGDTTQAKEIHGLLSYLTNLHKPDTLHTDKNSEHANFVMEDGQLPYDVYEGPPGSKTNKRIHIIHPTDSGHLAYGLSKYFESLLKQGVKKKLQQGKSLSPKHDDIMLGYSTPEEEEYLKHMHNFVNQHSGLLHDFIQDRTIHNAVSKYDKTQRHPYQMNTDAKNDFIKYLRDRKDLEGNNYLDDYIYLVTGKYPQERHRQEKV